MSSESPSCGFLCLSLPHYSVVSGRFACRLSFNTRERAILKQSFVKRPTVDIPSRSSVVRLAMSTIKPSTRFIESDFSVFRISNSVEELVTCFGDYFLEIASKAIERQGSFTLAISGGSVLQYFSRAVLETTARREAVPWEKTLIFLVDERYVPWDDPQSNYGQLRKALQMSNIEHKVKVSLHL